MGTLIVIINKNSKTMIRFILNTGTIHIQQLRQRGWSGANKNSVDEREHLSSSILII